MFVFLPEFFNLMKIYQSFCKKIKEFKIGLDFEIWLKPLSKTAGFVDKFKFKKIFDI